MNNMKKLKHSKPKKKSLPKLIKELDTIFSKYIRQRDGNKCVICGSTKNVQCGHLIRRGKGAVRWDEHNCNGQCSCCNIKHEYWPEPYTKWFLDMYGESGYAYLLNKSNQEYKHNRTDIEEKIEKYKKLVNGG